jgi:hypothetical protein
LTTIGRFSIKSPPHFPEIFIVGRKWYFCVVSSSSQNVDRNVNCKIIKLSWWKAAAQHLALPVAQIAKPPKESEQEEERTEKKRMVRILKNTLPLQVFIRRAQVTSAYRQLLRAARYCQDPALRKDITEQIRVEFQRNRDIQDNALIRSCIQDATKSLKKVEDLVGISKGQSAQQGSVEVVASKRTVKSETGGSWLEVEDEEDKRGRVGEGWPWSI